MSNKYFYLDTSISETFSEHTFLDKTSSLLLTVGLKTKKKHENYEEENWKKFSDFKKCLMFDYQKKEGKIDSIWLLKNTLNEQIFFQKFCYYLKKTNAIMRYFGVQN